MTLSPKIPAAATRGRHSTVGSTNSLIRRRQLLSAMEKRVAVIEQRITDLERTITDANYRQAPVAAAERVLCAAMRTRTVLLNHCEATRTALEQETDALPDAALPEPRS